MGSAVVVRFKDGAEEEFENVVTWKVEDGLLAMSLKGDKASYVPLADIRLFEANANGGNGKTTGPKSVKALKDYHCQACGVTIAKGTSYFWVRPSGDVTKAEIRVCQTCFERGVGTAPAPSLVIGSRDE